MNAVDNYRAHMEAAEEEFDRIASERDALFAALEELADAADEYVDGPVMMRARQALLRADR